MEGCIKKRWIVVEVYNYFTGKNCERLLYAYPDDAETVNGNLKVDHFERK